MSLMISEHRATTSARRAVVAIASALEHHKVTFLSLFCAMFLLTCCALSATKLLWYDELATLYPAMLPSAKSVVDFFQTGMDVHTPIASLVTWASIRLFGEGPVMDRLPYTLGYLVFCISIFTFVARRCPAIYASTAMLFPTLTLMFYYATELRCYGLVLGLVGLALVAWQAAGEEQRGPLLVGALWLSLAGAISLHYYSAFVLVPLGLAQLTRTWIDKRIDWPVWLALVFSPIVIFPFLPGIHAAQSIYSGNMRGLHPHLGQIQTAYVSLLSISNAPILGAIMICLLLAPSLGGSSYSKPKIIPLPEIVLAAALALLPVFVVIAALRIGAFNDRYVLACVGGIAILLAFALYKSLRGDPFVPTVLTLIFLVWFVAKNVPEIQRQMRVNGGLTVPLGEPWRRSVWMHELEGSNLPVAVVGATLFMQVQYYASPAVQPRVNYLTDIRAARIYGDETSTDINMINFSRHCPLRVVDYHEFIARNRHFLVCEQTLSGDWLIPMLLQDKAEIRLLERSEPFRVYEVTTQ